MVTSPGGTTEAGLKVFEDRGLKGMVGEALGAARKRAEELGRRV
jgi:pyrroline-5-carboxylate reductase